MNITIKLLSKAFLSEKSLVYAENIDPWYIPIQLVMMIFTDSDKPLKPERDLAQVLLFISSSGVLR